MKKFLLLFFVATFFLAGCSDSDAHNDDDDKEQIDDTDKNNSDDNDDKKENSTFVNFVNTSHFTIDIFDNSIKKSTDLVCTVNSGEQKKIPVTNFLVNSNNEAVFYINYHINLGVDISWSDNKEDVGVDVTWADSLCYKVVSVEKDKTVNLVFSDPNEMTTPNCYLVLENESSSVIELKRGSAPLYPDNGSDSSLLNSKKTGVYKISKTFFENFSQFKIVDINKSNSEIAFPSQFTKFESGKIFTIVISDSGASLKSISPFNIDTQKQMWSATVENGELLNCVRPAKDLKDGIFITGSCFSSKENVHQVFVKKIDVYGSTSSERKVNLKNSGSAKSCSVIDAFQSASGKYVLLIQLDFEKKTPSYYLASINLEGSITNDEVFDLSNNLPKNTTLFFATQGSKNLICELSENKIGVFGSLWDSDSKSHYFAEIVDLKSSGSNITYHWINENGCEAEQYFTSAIFDGSDIYVCGYDNFDGNCKDRIHKSDVYKFSLDLNSHDLIYTKEKQVLFGIEKKEDKIFVCGEIMGTGADNMLHGCLDIIDSATKTEISSISYTGSFGDSYFTQISLRNDGVSMCGINTTERFEPDNYRKDALLVSYSSSGDKLWENEYSDYSNILSMCSNNIGTEILHLTSESENKIISTDFLGKEKK